MAPRDSHKATLLTVARRALRGPDALVARGELVLVAVSGGRDSIALLHVLAALRAELAIGVVAHGVDHGLRPAAPRELDLAERLARSVDVPFARTRVDLGRASGNLQARARKARWEALEAAAARAGAQAIATAHHADDRAETVLLRLLRGAGARGLAVLPPRDAPGRVPRIRPLLGARRADVDAHVTRHRLAYADDPSNDDPRHLRVRVRRELLPLLEALSPHVVTHLAALADDLAELERDAGPDGPLDRTPPRTYTLPRRTAVALAHLRDTRSADARILLPGGIVARYEGSRERDREVDVRTVAVGGGQPHVLQPEKMVRVKGHTRST